MNRRMWGETAKGLIVILSIVTVMSGRSLGQDSGNKKDDNFDVRSNYGDLHLGSDATPGEIGLPAYPGSRPRHADKDRSNANLAMLTQAFGFKLLIANYDSDESPDKLIAYYRDKLKKYGKVLECHSSSSGRHIQAHPDDNDSKELKCDDDGDSDGSGIELKAGTDDNQHDVAIKPSDNGKGSTYAIIYVRTRGKQGDI